MERVPSVAEWMNGKDVLITGATGFMGKALVEKLLRCCPGINRLYLIVRSKRGHDPDERLKEYRSNIVFSVLLEKYPNAFDKVTVIPGDITEPECGISEKHQQLLIDNVQIVFHGAATVRFDHSLSDALKMNTRGTYELTKMAKRMKKLEVFEYISTTYSNANLQEKIGEKVYPSHLDWKDLIALLDKEDYALDCLLHKLIWTQPNTYTLSKSLAENVVLEAGKDLPAVIIRPSVVISSMDEPLPGWTDNLNGLVGVTVGCAKGVLRTFRCAPNTALDFVPVDISIHGLVAAAWSKRFFNENGDLQVFNQAYAERVSMTFSDILQEGMRVTQILPCENYIWYPFMIITNNTYYYHFLFFTLQLIPAILQDLLLRAVGRQPFLVRLNTKIYNAAMALSDFSEKEFKFDSAKYHCINYRMCEEDRKTFVIDAAAKTYEIEGYVMNFMRGVKKYVFNEQEEDLPRLRRNHQRLYYIDRATKVIVIGFVLWKLLQWASPLFF